MTLQEAFIDLIKNPNLEISKLNQNATNIASHTINKLEEFSNIALEIFEAKLQMLGLPEENTHKTRDIFNSILIEGSKSVSSKIKGGLKEGKGVLFNATLTEGAINIIDSIIEYRRVIDQNFPGLADCILEASKLLITALIGAFAPAVAVALQSSGVLDKAKEFFSIETLEKTSNLLHERLEKLEKDTQVKPVVTTGIKFSELASVTAVSLHTLNSLCMDEKNITKITELAKGSNGVKEFFKELSLTADLMPVSKKDSEQKLIKVVKELENLIDKSDLPKDEAMSLKENLRTATKEGIKILKKIPEDTSIFSKMLHAQETANTLLQVFNKINSKIEDKESLFSEASKVINHSICGKALHLAKECKKYPILAKELGLETKIELSFSKFNSSLQR